MYFLCFLLIGRWGCLYALSQTAENYSIPITEAKTYKIRKYRQLQPTINQVDEFTNRELCFQFINLLLPILQLLSCLIGLKLGLRLKMVKWILQSPMLLQKLLPLQPRMKTWQQLWAHEHIRSRRATVQRGLTHAYWTLSSWSCVLIRLLESWLISLCCSLWPLLSSLFTVASSLSDDCSTRRRSRISLLSTEGKGKKELNTELFSLPLDNRNLQVQHKQKSTQVGTTQEKNLNVTFCCLLFRLKALLQLIDSFLQSELIPVLVSSLSAKLLHQE